MSIQKVNSVSFKGIRKVVKTISPKDAKIIQDTLNKKNPLSSLMPAKESPITQIVNFFSGKKIVGTIHKYKDGSFIGTRTFADGTKVTYSADYILTKKSGEKLYSSAVAKGKGILAPSIPYKPFDKNGNIITPTLKEIKDFNKPENIINLIKTGELKVVNTKRYN